MTDINKEEQIREITARLLELQALYKQMRVVEANTIGAMDFCEGVINYITARADILNTQLGTLTKDRRDKNRKAPTNPATMRAAKLSLVADNTH